MIINGVIVVNKLKGFTSHDIVNKMRKILNMKKIGHTGTLDPNATGVLPILLGNGTKLSKYLIEHDKTYIATLKLGEKTTTGDSDGDVIERGMGGFPCPPEQIKEVLSSFIGKQKQIPPMYSAIKLNGKKLYEYALEGKEIEREPREIEIYDIKLLDVKTEDKEITFEVSCSKGTYIRVLCEDIAEKLGTIGHMKDLERITVGADDSVCPTFTIENSITLEELENNKENIDYINSKVISIEKIFENKKAIKLDDRKLELFLNGVQLSYELEDDIYRIYSEYEFIGLGIAKNMLLKRDVVV